MLTFILRSFYFSLLWPQALDPAVQEIASVIMFLNLSCFCISMALCMVSHHFFPVNFPHFMLFHLRWWQFMIFEKNINLFHLSMLESCKQKLSSNILRFQIICFSFLFTLCFPETIQDLGKNKIQNWKIYLTFINYFTFIVSHMPSNKEGVTYFPSQNNNFETEPRFYGSFHFK